MAPSAIPTTYAAGAYRSRLEARWAAFFDAIGWRYTYEPFDAAGYIPDFVIHGDAPLIVEVGPCITRDDYIGKLEKAQQNAIETMAVGVNPLSEGKYGAGVLFIPNYRSDKNPEPHGAIAMMKWVKCPTCSATCVGLLHDGEWTALRPCGHTPSGPVYAPDMTKIETNWRSAGAQTQWGPRR